MLENDIKIGDYLIAKKDTKIPTWNPTTAKETPGFEVKENEPCEIIKILDNGVIEIKTKTTSVGFSIIQGTKYEFYEKYFYNYIITKMEMRKNKLNKLKNI